MNRANLTHTTTSVCYVCSGTGMIRLNHAAVSSCWHCDRASGTVRATSHETWTSWERALADKSPFTSGAHSTMPLFYVGWQIKRFEAHTELLSTGDSI